MSRRRSVITRLGGNTSRHVIALILAYALFGNSLWAARIGISARAGSPTEETTTKPTMQERILEVPSGTVVEVRLLNKQRLRGRLGEVTNEGFSLQTAQGTMIETQKIAFTDVKNFKPAEGTTGSKVGKGVVYGLAGLGVLVVIMVIWALAHYND